MAAVIVGGVLLWSAWGTAATNPHIARTFESGEFLSVGMVENSTARVYVRVTHAEGISCNTHSPAAILTGRAHVDRHRGWAYVADLRAIRGGDHLLTCRGADGAVFGVGDGAADERADSVVVLKLCFAAQLCAAAVAVLTMLRRSLRDAFNRGT